MSTTKEILADILEERHAQDVKWEPQRRSPVEWISILTEEVGEAAERANWLHFQGLGTAREFKLLTPRTEKSREQLRAELIQVAAVAVSAIEHIDNRVAEVT